MVDAAWKGDQPDRPRRHVQPGRGRGGWSATAIAAARRPRAAHEGEHADGRRVQPPGRFRATLSGHRVDNSMRQPGRRPVDRYQIHPVGPDASRRGETLSAWTTCQRAGKPSLLRLLEFPAYRIVQAEWAARMHHLSRYGHRTAQILRSAARDRDQSCPDRAVRTRRAGVDTMASAVWARSAKAGRSPRIARRSFAAQRLDTACRPTGPGSRPSSGWQGRRRAG